MQSLKKHWKGILKLFGPILFIFLVLKIVDPGSVINLLKGMQIYLVLLSILFFPVQICIFTLRWWIICRRLGMGNTFWRTFQIYYISWFLGSFPLSGASAVSKVFYLREEDEPMAKNLLSVTLDKFFDLIGTMLFGVYGLLYFPGNIVGIKSLWVVFCGISIVIFIIMLSGKRIWERLKGLLKNYLKKGLRGLVKDFEVNFTDFWSGFSFSFFSFLLGLSIFIGIFRSLVLYVLAISMGLEITFGLIIACRALIGIVNIIPISVSGLGTRDAVLLLTLPVAGVSKEAALALGFLAFLWTVFSKFSGAPFWLKRPLPSRTIQKFKDKLFNDYE